MTDSPSFENLICETVVNNGVWHQFKKQEPHLPILCQPDGFRSVDEVG